MYDKKLVLSIYNIKREEKQNLQECQCIADFSTRVLFLTRIIWSDEIYHRNRLSGTSTITGRVEKGFRESCVSTFGCMECPENILFQFSFNKCVYDLKTLKNILTKLFLLCIFESTMLKRETNLLYANKCRY